MAEPVEADGREGETGSLGDESGEPDASPRVDPDAAVVAPHAPVAPDPHPEELPTRLRPLSTVRGIGTRLRELLASARRRGRSGRGN